MTTPHYPGKPCIPGGIISHVDPLSPADDAGFTPGCSILAVDGNPICDILDWQWYSDGDEMLVAYMDTQGDCGEVELFREEGESWGITFEGAIFDAIKTCRNACIFCFMRQLPQNCRETLILRDDDWRLSFLQGNFVTLTNLSEEDCNTIISRGVSPLRVSLHATDPQIRQQIMGKHAAWGLEMLNRLLQGGIQVDCQVVLMPGVNDGEVLKQTLAWAYLQDGITHVGIVPLGFTQYQERFSASFDEADAAAAVIEDVEPFQRHALAERGYPWVYLADEFYLNAFGPQVIDALPPASHYGDFSMFEDGIGIVRSQVDEWQNSLQGQQALTQVLQEEGLHLHWVMGQCQTYVLAQLISSSPLSPWVHPLIVENRYFGGNVNVTGLLCGCDIAAAMQEGYAAGAISSEDYILIPDVVLNEDGVTLDDMTVEDIRDAGGLPVSVVPCQIDELLQELLSLLS